MWYTAGFIINLLSMQMKLQGGVNLNSKAPAVLTIWNSSFTKEKFLNERIQWRSTKMKTNTLIYWKIQTQRSTFPIQLINDLLHCIKPLLKLELTDFLDNRYNFVLILWQMWFTKTKKRIGPITGQWKNSICLFFHQYS